MALHHHLIPHRHDGGEFHRAHLISNTSLFVYFQLLLIFGSFVFFTKAKNPDILGAIIYSPSEIIKLTNQQRQKSGLGDVVENPLLDQAAASKAADMFANDYWAHYSPSGKSPWVFINAAGYKYIYAGENLARDFENANEVVYAWMNSPSHRANLLDKNFKEIGVAVSDGKLGGREGILVVQMFGSSMLPVETSERGVGQNKPNEAKIAGEQVKSEVVAPVKPGISISGFSFARGVTLGIVGLIFVFFVVELVVSLKSSHLKLQPQVIAHILLLGLAMLALWYSASGAIV